MDWMDATGAAERSNEQNRVRQSPRTQTMNEDAHLEKETKKVGKRYVGRKAEDARSVWTVASCGWQHFA